MDQRIPNSSEYRVSQRNYVVGFIEERDYGKGMYGKEIGKEGLQHGEFRDSGYPVSLVLSL